MKEIHRNAKFEDEDEMLRKYQVHMRLMKEMDKIVEAGSEGSWKDLLTQAKDKQELKVSSPRH